MAAVGVARLFSLVSRQIEWRSGISLPPEIKFLIKNVKMKNIFIFETSDQNFFVLIIVLPY